MDKDEVKEWLKSSDFKNFIKSGYEDWLWRQEMDSIFFLDLFKRNYNDKNDFVKDSNRWMNETSNMDE